MKSKYQFSDQNFMLLSKLDSINVSHDKRANGELGLVEQILCGNIPVLSLNQAIDSPIIVNTLLTEANNSKGNRHMLSLFEDGIIRIKEFNQFSSVLKYVDFQLASHTDESRVPFVFSSIPLLNPADDTYSRAELVEIISAMRSALASGKPQKIRQCSILSKYEGHVIQIESYLRAMMLLDKATRDNLTIGVPRDQIPDDHKLLGLLKKKYDWMKDEKNKSRPHITSTLIELIEQLIDIGNMQQGEAKHSRSILYNYLMKIIGRDKNNDYTILHSLKSLQLLSLTQNNPEDVFYACAVIDICYNEAIAYSVSDEGLSNQALDVNDPLVDLFDDDSYVVENSTAVIGTETEVDQVAFSVEDDKNSTIQWEWAPLTWEDINEMVNSIRRNVQKESQKNPDASFEDLWFNAAKKCYSWLPIKIIPKIVGDMLIDKAKDMVLPTIFAQLTSIGSALFPTDNVPSCIGDYDCRSIIPFAKNASNESNSPVPVIINAVGEISNVNTFAQPALEAVRQRKALRYIFNTYDITSRQK